jgi:hypothetical protein
VRPADFREMIDTAIKALKINQEDLGPLVLQALNYIVPKLKHPDVDRMIKLLLGDDADKVEKTLAGLLDTENSLINDQVGDHTIAMLNRLENHRLVFDALALLA